MKLLKIPHKLLCAGRTIHIYKIHKKGSNVHPCVAETLRAGKNDGYFDFEQDKNSTHRDVSRNLIQGVSSMVWSLADGAAT